MKEVKKIQEKGNITLKGSEIEIIMGVFEE